MYSGVDGRELEADIFFGVVYYQRLRHMVADKFQVSHRHRNVVFNCTHYCRRSAASRWRVTTRQVFSRFSFFVCGSKTAKLRPTGGSANWVKSHEIQRPLFYLQVRTTGPIDLLTHQPVQVCFILTSSREEAPKWAVAQVWVSYCNHTGDVRF